MKLFQVVTLFLIGGRGRSYRSGGLLATAFYISVMVLMRIPRLMFIPLSAALAGCLTGCHGRKPPPSIDGLNEALERSAEKTLAAPTLANEQVIVPAKPGGVDARAAEVLSEASAAGGAGIRSSDAQGRVSILATIPDNNADAFKAALRHEIFSMDKPSGTSRLIEVLVETPTASPSP